jgi:hypothetical protein
VIAPDGRTEYDVWQHYVVGRPEDIKSRLFDSGTDPGLLCEPSSVATPPGSTTPTRTCRWVSSWRRDSVKPFTPNLVKL